MKALLVLLLILCWAIGISSLLKGDFLMAFAFFGLGGLAVIVSLEK